MQRNLLLAILLTAAVVTVNVTSVVYATQGGGAQQLRYEIVESRPLPPNTGRVVLGGKTSTSAGYVKIAVGRRKLSASRSMDDKLQIFDASGNAMHTRQFETRKYTPDQGRTEIEGIVSRPGAFSKYGNFYIINTTLVRAEPGALYKFRREIFDAGGNKQWEEEVETGYDSNAPVITLSDFDGSSVINNYETINFLSPDGTVIKEINDFKPMPWIDLITSISYSVDGNYIIINVGEDGERLSGNGTWTILYNNRGDELWRVKGEFNNALIAAISPDNNYILSGDWDPQSGPNMMIYILNRDGDLLNTIGDFVINGIHFSNDSKIAVVHAVNRNHRRVFVSIELASGEVLFEKQTNGNWESDIASEKQLVAMMVNRRLEVVTYDGVQVFRYDFADGEVGGFPTGRGETFLQPPNVQISEDGSEIFVRLVNRTVRFRLQ